MPDHADASTILPEPLEPRALLAVTLGPTPVASNAVLQAVLVAADFDGDGTPDVVGRTGAGTIAFHRGQGDGTFAAGVDLGITDSVHEAAALELLPGGGRELVLVGNVGRVAPFDGFRHRAALVRVLAWDAGAGTLIRVAMTRLLPPEGGFIDRPGTPIAGDFDGDGDTDLAIAPGRNLGRVDVLNLSGASLTRARTLTSDPFLPQQSEEGGLVLGAPPQGADLNADGRTDLIVRTAAGYRALLNSAAGLASPAVPLGLSNLFEWRFVDMDLDGRADAVNFWRPPETGATFSDPDYVVARVKHGLGDGTFAGIQVIGRLFDGGPVPFPASGSSENFKQYFAGPDVDGDGRPDVGLITLWHNTDRSGYYGTERVVVAQQTAPRVYAAPRVAFTQSLSTGFLGPPPAWILPESRMAWADVNGDGRADLVLADQLRVLLNTDA